MFSDHRRPLVAYLLVALAGVLVMAQGVRGAVETDPGPSYQAYADAQTTPREGEALFPPLEDPIGQAPQELSYTLDAGGLSPALDAVLGIANAATDVSAPVLDPGSAPVTTPGSVPPAVDGDGGASGTDSALVAGPRTDGGGGGFGDGDGGGGFGGPGQDDGGVFGAPLPDDPDDAPQDPDTTGGPKPHSFGHVPEGAHPYGDAGPKPGKGDGGNYGDAASDHPGQGKGPDKGPDKGKGNGHAAGPDRAPDRDWDDEGKGGKPTTPGKPAKADKPPKPPKADKPEKAPKPPKADKPGKAPKPPQGGKPDKPAKADKPAKPGKP